jgi:hypothetical protein
VTLRYMHLPPSALRDAIRLLDQCGGKTGVNTGGEAQQGFSKSLSLKLGGGRDLNPETVQHR